MAAATCYNWNTSSNRAEAADPRYDQPCPSGGGCCNPGDTCVGNFMCKHKEIATDPNRPDYYIAACTDKNFASSACVKFCYQYGRTGVIYNTTSDQWTCCGTTSDGSGGLQTTCATPKGPSFDLVPPNALEIRGIAGGGPASSSSTSAVPSSATSSASVTSWTAVQTTDAPPSPSNNMNVGTQVGLGVGLGLGIALIIVLAIFFLRKRSRSKRNMSELPAEKDSINDSYFAPSKQEIKWSYNSQKPIQLESTHTAKGIDMSHRELPAESVTPRVELS